jgi:Raf kinase inhibitor-like YbhB/YbcL family protein
MPFLLVSPGLPPGGDIPKEYTCDGSDISPPLSWSGAPPGTASFAVVVEDPDAPGGVFRHWAAYDIPPTSTGLPGGFHAGRPAPFREARNDFGSIGYRGPCPPPGAPHHYHIELMALNRPTLAVAAPATVSAVIAAAAPYIIARVELVGAYQR